MFNYQGNIVQTKDFHRLESDIHVLKRCVDMDIERHRKAIKWLLIGLSASGVAHLATFFIVLTRWFQ